MSKWRYFAKGLLKKHFPLMSSCHNVDVLITPSNNNVITHPMYMHWGPQMITHNLFERRECGEMSYMHIAKSPQQPFYCYCSEVAKPSDAPG